MKRIDECTDMTVLVALLVLGILLVMSTGYNRDNTGKT